MATINYAAREISVKIVYYGPGLSGKTTNLQIIHRKIPGQSKSDMVSLATETDRTLFFDFLPLDLGKIRGFTTKFQLYTVPGQVYYNATRKLVLRGVDGIVFIADSAADKYDENVESFDNMEENLAEYGYKRESIPIILQYNKRDLPNAMPTDELNAQFNRYNLMWSEAIASKGKGVFESLKLIGKLVIDQLNQKYSSTAKKRSTNQAKKTVQPPSQTAQPISVSKSPLTQQNIQVQEPQSSPNPYSPPPSQEDPNFMKFGEINVEPMAPKKTSTLYDAIPPEVNTPGTGANNNSVHNVNEANRSFEPPQFEPHQPPLSDGLQNPNQGQYTQGNFEPQHAPNPVGPPVFNQPIPQNNQYDNRNLVNEQTSVPNNKPQPQYNAQPQQYSDYTTPQSMQQNPPSNQYPEDSFDQDSINKPMFFTSIDKEKQKKGKKPVNPKHKTKQNFFSKFFKRGG